jgi:phosphoglycolate phosphatase
VYHSRYGSIGLFENEPEGCHIESGHVRRTDLVRDAVDAAGGSRSEMVMIGDRAEDIRGAKESGIRSIAAGWGFGSEEELRLAEPDLTVHSMAELVERLLPHR